MGKVTQPLRTRDDYLVLGRRLFDLREDLIQVIVHEIGAWPQGHAGHTDLKAALAWIDRARSAFDKQFHRDGLRDRDTRPEFPMYPGRERHESI